MDSFVLAVLVAAFLLGVKFAVDLFRKRPRKALITTHLTSARIASTPTHAGHPVVSSASAVSYCEVRDLNDAPAVPCGHSANAKCSNCGTLLCSAHTERCELCGRFFCQFCLSFHQSEHPKPSPARRAHSREAKESLRAAPN
jgi:hypothetical protein